MSTKIIWDGTVTQTPTDNSLWSKTGGSFKSCLGITTYFPLPLKYRFTIPALGAYTIPPKFAQRPDLIAKEIYGSEDYWWLIYWASGIIDPFGLVRGTEILVVDLSELQKLL